MTRPWGCPKCGGKESLVGETSRDSEGYVVRLRRCNALTGCDGSWETEERVMAPGSFWGRAEEWNDRRRERLRQAGPKVCHRCGGEYVFGQYRLHVQFSKRHAAVLAPPANRSTKPRHELRRYQREWKRRVAA